MVKHISGVLRRSRRFVGWRGLHVKEGGRSVPPGMPAILNPIETRALNITRDMQLMSYELMLHFAPALPREKWRVLHRFDKAMTNGGQNGFDGVDALGRPVLHADYINNRDLTAPLPRYDKMQRSFQGSFIRGEAVGDELVCRPGVHGIDATRPMPSVAEIVANNWFIRAVTAGEEVDNFPQGDGYPIVYPFIFDRPISFPLAWFERWDREYLPDPLRFYR